MPPPSASREPRQRRGQERIEQILEAADALFVEVGFEAATTNAIASRLGISIGSLYQYFRNKDAILHALAERHLENIRAVNAGFREPEVASLPYFALIDRVIDDMAAYHGANPGFRLLFCGSMTTGQLAASNDELCKEIARGTEGLLLGSLPGLDPSKAGLVATIVVDLVRALMMTASTCDAADRAAVLDEAKAVLKRYVEPWATR